MTLTFYLVGAAAVAAIARALYEAWLFRAAGRAVSRFASASTATRTRSIKNIMESIKSVDAPRLEATTKTLLKPLPIQSAAMLEKPYAHLIQIISIKSRFLLYESVEEGDHTYVVMAPESAPDKCMNGFLYNEHFDVEESESAKALERAVKEVSTVQVSAIPKKKILLPNGRDYKHPTRPDYPDHIDLSEGDFPARLIGYAMDQNWQVDTGHRHRNIFYMEGAKLEGTLNSDAFDRWNDFRCIVSFYRDGVPYFALAPTVATTEPGKFFTDAPMHPGGAFRIALGQHLNAWMHGGHGWNSYRALVQTGDLGYFRDKNKDGSRTGDIFYVSANNAVNQHHGNNARGSIGRESAGCLVGRDIVPHFQFMDLLELDPRYIDNRWLQRHTAIIDGTHFAKSKWGYGR